MNSLSKAQYSGKNEKELDSIMRQTISRLNQKSKGVLAADESNPTLKVRFDKINLESTCETRLNYRRLLLLNPVLKKYISGVILHSETFENHEIRHFLSSSGIEIGVKVDMGSLLFPLKNNPLVKHTIGFDTLRERCSNYFSKGARFVKWRSFIKIENGQIDPEALNQMCQEQALYAATAQAEGLVPIIEPELCMDGDHSREIAFKFNKKIISNVLNRCISFGVQMKFSVLKIAMVTAGIACESRKTETFRERIESDSLMTLECLEEVVPAGMGSINFLSGGQTESEASFHLNEINRMMEERKEKSGGGKNWNGVSFSFGRALQGSVLKTWQGSEENDERAKQEFENLLGVNSQARDGGLAIDWETFRNGSSPDESHFVEGYVY